MRRALLARHQRARLRLGWLVVVVLVVRFPLRQVVVLILVRQHEALVGMQWAGGRLARHAHRGERDCRDNKGIAVGIGIGFAGKRIGAIARLVEIGGWI